MPQGAVEKGHSGRSQGRILIMGKGTGTFVFFVVAFPCTKEYTLEQMKNIKETFKWLKTMTT